MKLSFLLLFCFIGTVVSFKPFDASIKRNPGDTIYQDCEDITISGQTIPNVCIQLTEDESCGIHGVLSAAGNQIVAGNFDEGLAPELCGNYKISGITCQVCLALQPENADNQRCLTVTPVCLGVEHTETVTCLPESTIPSCGERACPNNCNGHGDCVDGVCKCTAMYHGSDCSTAEPLFEQCETIDEVTGDVCVQVAFGTCTMETHIVIQNAFGEIPIYEKDISIKYLLKVFDGAPQNVSVGACELYLTWTNLTMNTSLATGCGHLAIRCIGNYNYDYDLGCFEDTQVFPSCFVCPDECNGHGTCDDWGFCHCNGDYVGDDCASTAPCPEDCSGHGTCDTKGKCHCDGGWAGTACSIVNQDTSSVTHHGPNLAAILIPVFIVIGIAIAVGVVIYMKRRAARPGRGSFRKLDLMSTDDEDEELAS